MDEATIISEWFALDRLIFRLDRAKHVCLAEWHRTGDPIEAVAACRLDAELVEALEVERFLRGGFAMS